jgi:cell pole-organizing protein PopZ
VEIKNILDSIKTLINDSNERQQDILELTEIVDFNDEEKSFDEDKKLSKDKPIDPSIKRLLDINNRINAETKINTNKILRPLEEAIIELVKPQLDSWLQLNLNKIVTKVVENEIQKILTNDKNSHS